MNPRIRSEISRALCLTVLLAGCAGDPEPRACPSSGDAGTAKPAFVHDRTVQAVIERYQLTLISAITAKGAPLSCSQVPGTYSMGHPDLVILSTQTIPRSTKDANSTVIPNLNFPVGKELLIVAEGLGRDSFGGAHVVARGCVDKLRFNTCNPIPLGWDKALEIDLIATTGAPCAGQKQGCENNMICLSDISGGYCAKAGCSSDGRCPPASICTVNTKSVGSCMRKCADNGDCKWNQAKGQGPWDCAYRKGGDGKCYRVCVPPAWNTSYICTPGS